MVESLPRWGVVCTGPAPGVGLVGVEKGACEGCTSIVYVYHINYYKFGNLRFPF